MGLRCLSCSFFIPPFFLIEIIYSLYEKRVGGSKIDIVFWVESVYSFGNLFDGCVCFWWWIYVNKILNEFLER